MDEWTVRQNIIACCMWDTRALDNVVLCKRQEEDDGCTAFGQDWPWSKQQHRGQWWWW